MLYIPTIMSVLEVLAVTIPVLLTVAFITIAERKTMASMQRRLGPNAVGWYGLLQAFADALKLLLKEYVSPTQANIVLFFLGPIITLIFALLGYAIVPYGPGLVILDYNLGILYLLAMSSLATYGILLAGCRPFNLNIRIPNYAKISQNLYFNLAIISIVFIFVLLLLLYIYSFNILAFCLDYELLNNNLYCYESLLLANRLNKKDYSYYENHLIRFKHTSSKGDLESKKGFRLY
jgi:formate hydrogenlyase subunit 4